MGELARRGGVDWFGDPLSQEGADLVTFSETTEKEVDCELMLVEALRNGAEDTPDLRADIELRASEQEKRRNAERRARGVAPDLRALVAANRKKDVEQLARDMVIRHEDFADFLHSCRLLGLSRHSSHYEWVPGEGSLEPEERASPFESGTETPGPTVLGKARQLVEEREHRSVHMFTTANASRWHCFYLTFKDVGGAPFPGNHHWNEGARVHFVNHLFQPQRLTRRVVMAQLAQREHSINGLPIRFEVSREKRGPE